MELLWFFPTGGDGRYLGTSHGERKVDLPYLKEIAQAVDSLGYKGALLPTGQGCEDAWVAASSLVTVTQNMDFLIALRPGLMSPTLAARMAATFDQFSGGRLLLNIVTGSDPTEHLADGIHLNHTERYKLTEEFLEVWTKVMRGEAVDFEGEYFNHKGAKNFKSHVQKPYPPLYFSGSSDIAIEIAAKYADVYLTWGEPPAQVKAKIDKVKELAKQHGRDIKFGIRLNIVVRETEEEAWQAANDLIKYADDETIAALQERLTKQESVGQKSMNALHNGKKENLEVSPNLWAGLGLVREGAATALVGDPETVAARLLEYYELGIDQFIVSGYPHLEEAHRVAELLFKHLPLETNKKQVVL